MSDEVITRDEVWNVIDFMNALYSSAPLDKNNYFYDTINEYKTLVDLNNNEQIPDRDSLRQAIATYKNSAETLQDYSEFMETWDAIYKRAIEYKTNLLAFDIDRVPINIVDDDEFESEEYKEDCKRVDKFFNYFKKSFYRFLFTICNPIGTNIKQRTVIITNKIKSMFAYKFIFIVLCIAEYDFCIIFCNKFYKIPFYKNK